MIDKTTELQKEIFMDEKLETKELPEKNSKRALYIRRTLEDHKESKRLSALIGDDYWSEL